MMYGRGQSESTAAVTHGSSVKMYMSGSVVGSCAIFILLQYLVTLTDSDNTAHQIEIHKCCSSGCLFNEHLTCVNRTTINESGAVVEEMVDGEFQCQDNKSSRVYEEYNMENQSYVSLNIDDNVNNSCIEEIVNGKTIIVRCVDVVDRSPSSMLELGSVIFWGAQTYMSTNLAHMILCIVVVVVYLSVPELGRGLYNRAVVRHTICLLMQGVVLQLLGYCELKDCQINDHLMILLWLVLQYFTIATVLWLNGICLDMTLAIMKFQWIARNADKSGEVEARKLLVYGIFAWGGSLLPTLLAGLCDYISQVPRHFILKPNYLNYRNGPSAVVNLYFFLVPAAILLLNNILFLCTTWRIVKIQRSTEIVTRNQRNILKKKYFLFLRLYLLMGAPWFFGMLLACLNVLIVLKICRMIQPVLWLLMLTTHKDLLRRGKQVLLKCKHWRKGDHCPTPPTTVSSNS